MKTTCFVLILFIVISTINSSIRIKSSNEKQEKSKDQPIKYDPKNDNLGFFTKKNGYFFSSFGGNSKKLMYTYIGIGIASLVAIIFNFQYCCWISKKLVKYLSLHSILKSGNLVKAKQKYETEITSTTKSKLNNNQLIVDCPSLIRSKISFINCLDEQSRIPKFMIDNIISKYEAGNKDSIPTDESNVEKLKRQIIGFEINFFHYTGLLTKSLKEIKRMKTIVINYPTFENFKILNHNSMEIDQEQSTKINLSQAFLYKYISKIKYNFAKTEEEIQLLKNVIFQTNYDKVTLDRDQILFEDDYFKYFYNPPLLDEHGNELYKNVDANHKELNISINLLYLSDEIYDKEKIFIGKINENLSPSNSVKRYKENMDLIIQNTENYNKMFSNDLNQSDYLFCPYQTDLKETRYAICICCYENSNRIVINEAFEIEATAEDVGNKIIYENAGSLTSIILLNLMSLTIFVFSFYGLFFTLKTLYADFPIIEDLKMTGVHLFSLSIGVFIFFFIQLYNWIINFDLSWFFFFLIITLLALGCVLVAYFAFVVNEKEKKGFSGIDNIFNHENQKILDNK